jgi:hypothetical protein
VKLRRSTLDRIATAYAEAVATGDFESAEGWLATATFVDDRRNDKIRHRSFARLASSRSTSEANLATDWAAGSSPSRSNLNPSPPPIA